MNRHRNVGIVFSFSELQAIKRAYFADKFGKFSICKKAVLPSWSTQNWEDVLDYGPTPNYMILQKHNQFYKDLRPPVSVGDHIYVKETWRWAGSAMIDPTITYKFDGAQKCIRPTIKLITRPAHSWITSIRMLGSYSRFWMECTGVRLHRLLDITEKEAKKEGMIHQPGRGWFWQMDFNGQPERPLIGCSSAVCAYFDFFKYLYGANICEENPYVWQYTWKKVTSERILDV